MGAKLTFGSTFGSSVQTTLKISGMRSVHCARGVYTALASLPGVSSATVVVGEAVLEHQSDLPAGALDSAVAAMGYTVQSVVTQRRVMPLVSRNDEP